MFFEDALAQVRSKLTALDLQCQQLTAYVAELGQVADTDTARALQQARAVELRRSLRSLKAEADKVLTLAWRNPPQERGLFGFWARAVPPDSGVAEQYDRVVGAAKAAYDRIPVTVAGSRGVDAAAVAAQLDQADPAPAP